MEEPRPEPAPDPDATIRASGLESGSTLIHADRARRDPAASSWNDLVRKIDERVRGKHRPSSIPKPFTIDDVLQDTLCRTFRSLASTEFPDSKRFWAWIDQLSNNAVVDLARGERADKRGGGARHEPLEAAADAADRNATGAQTEARTIEIRDALLDCLAALGDRDREVVRARLFEQEPYESISARLGMTNLGSLRAIAKRGSDTVRACLRAKGIHGDT